MTAESKKDIAKTTSNYIRKTNVELDDSWKFGCYTCRVAVAVITGKVVGDTKVDEAVGAALAELFPPRDLAELGKQYDILVNAMAGAWKAVRRDEN